MIWFEAALQTCIEPEPEKSIESLLGGLPDEPSHLLLVAGNVFPDLLGGIDVCWRVGVGNIGREQADDRDELYNSMKQSSG